MSISPVLLSVVQSAPQDGVLDSILQSLPTDPAALFALGLCAAAVVAVVIAGRDKGQRPKSGGQTS